jgi:hypothetical protein
MKEEQLEFITVNQEDDLNNLLLNNAYADMPSGSEKVSGDSVVGNWVFKQSKVIYSILNDKINLFLKISNSHSASSGHYISFAL